MCGIAGSLNWDTPDQESKLTPVVEALTHRGPDAGGIISDGAVLLGHRRLSILDLRNVANQPMQDITGRFWIVFNGEIYNFKDLKEELSQLGAEFKTNSDTEVILMAWRYWQEKCVERFVGMFAFALWDSKEQSLFLARDRMGEKPLFYTGAQGGNLHKGIIFASELQALCQHPDITVSINPKALSQFLSLNYVLTDSCMVQGVHKLPPAHYLYLKRDQEPQLVEYWKLAHYFHNKEPWHSEKQAANRLNELLHQSVQSQMVADVPLGAFLSGGLDSSAIVAAMVSTQHASSVKSFSIDFTEQSYSELKQSQQVAQHLNTEHYVKTVQADMVGALKNIVYSADEPCADTSMIPMYFLAQHAKEHVTVCLSGDGGDELFAGYETNTADKLHRYFSVLPKPLIRFLSSLCENAMPTSLGKVSFDYKLKHFLHGCQYDARRAHYSWRSIFSEEEKALLLQSDTAAQAHDPFSSFDAYYQDVADSHMLDQAAYVDMKTWLANDILPKVDRMTMAHSLESRTPFLDHRMVEFAASLPVEYKMRCFTKKYLLKRSQEAYLPHNIINRRKEGFNSPVALWLQGEMLDYGQQILYDGVISERFDRKYIERLWSEHTKGTKDNSLKLFGLICLGLWVDKWQ